MDRDRIGDDLQQHPIALGWDRSSHCFRPSTTADLPAAVPPSGEALPSWCAIDAPMVNG